MNAFAHVVVWAIEATIILLFATGLVLLVHLLVFVRLDEWRDRRALRRMVEPTPQERTVPFDQFWDDAMRPYEEGTR